MDAELRGDAAHRSPYRRSSGSNRGERRRQELLDRVSDDLALNGLAEFSLRRAARAAGTTHKVLLYYFEGADDLLRQAVERLRGRRIDHSLAAATADGAGGSLAQRVRALWPVLVAPESGARVLDQAIGLALADPHRHGELGRDASAQYLPHLVALCPETWSDRRKHEVATMVLATLRGFLVHVGTTGDTAAVDAGFEALTRALDREEASTIE
jgi:AcrR family transcriptional regulator